MNRRIFQRDGVNRTHYSRIPSFHHSNCERSELSSVVSDLPFFTFKTARCIDKIMKSVNFDDNQRNIVFLLH
jgi:hypothetical protein